MGNSDSKTQLHTALTKLASETIPADQELLWASFWQLPASTELIFNTLTGEAMRDLRSKQPNNYITLIHRVMRQPVIIILTPYISNNIEICAQIAEPFN